VLLMLIAVVIAALFLAYSNGANDVSKGISTLVGSGVTNYRRAVAWGAAFTVAGALTAGFASQALVATFSGKGILRTPSTSPAFLLAVAIGAIGWLLVATRTGLPVSTTHSLFGSLLGVALMQSGTGSILWTVALDKFVVPLALSPIIAMALLMFLRPLLQPALAKLDTSCVCVEEAKPALVTPEGMMMRDAMPVITSGTTASCDATATAGIGALDAMHWVSAGATSFFRGLNDTPKVLAIAAGAGSALGIGSLSLYAAIGAAMGAGSIISGVRVTKTLAEKVTRISPPDGFTANVITATLVAFASRLALPVSTTHVSSGAIIGVGVARGSGGVRWGTVRDMGLAWIVTLPISMIIGAAAAFVLTR
jgi:inorganic phosphate transporter, PiT family